MSLVARWSYGNTAIVEPFIGEDGENGGTTYGAPYTIKCDYAAESKEYREAGAPAGRGVMFVSTFTIFTEDERPRYLDRITLDYAGAPAQSIRLRLVWPNGNFNDTPDYKLVT